MSPEFKVPVSKSEFRRRAESITEASAQAVITSLERRKAALVKPLDEEIDFYKKVIKYRNGGEV